MLSSGHPHAMCVTLLLIFLLQLASGGHGVRHQRGKQATKQTHQPPPPQFPRQYTVLVKATIRAGSSLDSQALGALEVGEVIEVVEAKELDPTRQLRLRFDRGWTSAVSKAGKQLLAGLDKPPPPLPPTPPSPPVAPAPAGESRELLADMQTVELLASKGLAAYDSSPGSTIPARRLQVGHRRRRRHRRLLLPDRAALTHALTAACRQWDQRTPLQDVLSRISVPVILMNTSLDKWGASKWGMDSIFDEMPQALEVTPLLFELHTPAHHDTPHTVQKRAHTYTETLRCSMLLDPALCSLLWAGQPFLIHLVCGGFGAD